ncbi:DUF945 family protein [Agaribacter marinus]|uniref:Tyrosinase copper-binding domain-containing protein n=1 Tax=Agaribacter marinus TaxID=1431249 RepID=A0AA37SZM0_9ALTE|nr:DUF945 family protein [Agaribacter marinus]GLR69100.1 hypothetical protein GCM10007852_00080 [Agaribacter marinus]
MKKIIIALIVVLVLFGLIGPKFTGNIFNNELDNIAEAISQQPMYKASIEKREQHWFSSTAELIVSMDLDGMPEAQSFDAFSLTIPIEAQHGPFLTQGGVGIGWANWQINIETPENFEGSVLDTDTSIIYQISARMGLLGTTHYADKVPALMYNDPASGAELTFTGWAGEGRFNQDLIEYEGDTESFKINVNGKDVLDLSNMKIDMDIDAGLAQILEKTLYASVSEISIDNLTFNDPESDDTGKLDNLLFTTTSSYNEKTDLGDILMSFKTQLIESPYANFNDIILDIEVRNLQGAFFKAYQDMTNRMLESPQASKDSINDLFEAPLLSQLQVNPEFNLPKLSGKVNDSAFEAFINTTLADVQALPSPLEDPAFWVQHALVDAKTTIEETAALFFAEQSVKSQLTNNPQFAQMSEQEITQIANQQAGATLAALVQQGMLSKTDSGYEFTFTLKDAKAELNGNPMPLPF